MLRFDWLPALSGAKSVRTPMRDSPVESSSNEAKPRNVRISAVHILKYHGFFDLESEILKPRWLPTPALLIEGIDWRRTVAPEAPERPAFL